MIRDSLVPAPRAGRVVWPTATVHAGVYQSIAGPDKTKSALALLMNLKYRNHLAPIIEGSRFRLVCQAEPPIRMTIPASDAKLSAEGGTVS
jgi:hypothetical protein